MRHVIILTVCAVAVAYIILFFIKKENKVATEVAKETKISFTTKIVSDYSSFNAYVDSSEQAQREADFATRLLLRSNMRIEKDREELKVKLEYSEKENRYLKNEIKSLTDSLRSYQRVRYQSN